MRSARAALIVRGDLDERLDAEASRSTNEVGKRGAAGDAPQDDEHRVGTRGRGSLDLRNVDDEVLAEKGQRDAGARGSKIVERAVEPLPIGENAHHGRAAGFVCLGALAGTQRA